MPRVPLAALGAEPQEQPGAAPWGELLDGLGTSAMAPVAYDTAWVARLRTANRRRALYPAALVWLTSQQGSDGSWGAEVSWPADRLAATLAAVVALAEAERDGLRRPPQGALAAGLRFVTGALAALRHGPPGALAADTVGFELVLPPLLAEARAYGLPVPAPPAWLRRRRAEKLARLPAGWRRRPPPSLAHSLEGWAADAPGPEGEAAAGDSLPEGLVDAATGCANSPSATAFLHRRHPRPAAAGYLQAACRAAGGAPGDVYPFEVFETAWVLDHLALAGYSLRSPDLAPHVGRLRRAWRPEAGVGIAAGGLEPDADDTAVTAVQLARAGVPVSAEPLRGFERDEGFACFPFERDPSVNVHVAYALSRLPYRGRVRALHKVLQFLADAQSPEGYWTDKWHASPYYATGRAVVALHRLAPGLAGRAVAWLRATQRADGSWGMWGGSPEETACAVTALRVAGVREPAAMRRAAAYLRECPARPALWVGKGLYCPRRVVEAAVWAARALCAGGRGA